MEQGIIMANIKYKHVNYKGFSITLTNYNGKTEIVIISGDNEFIANLAMDIDMAAEWAKEKIDRGLFN